MTVLDLLLLFLVILVGLTTLLTIKITKFIRKLEKLYDYFIVSENITDLELSERKLPPVNGQCPTKEALEKLK